MIGMSTETVSMSEEISTETAESEEHPRRENTESMRIDTDWSSLVEYAS